MGEDVFGFFPSNPERAKEHMRSSSGRTTQPKDMHAAGYVVVGCIKCASRLPPRHRSCAPNCMSDHDWWLSCAAVRQYLDQVQDTGWSLFSPSVLFEIFVQCDDAIVVGLRDGPSNRAVQGVRINFFHGLDLAHCPRQFASW